MEESLHTLVLANILLELVLHQTIPLCLLQICQFEWIGVSGENQEQRAIREPLENYLEKQQESLVHPVKIVLLAPIEDTYFEC